MLRRARRRGGSERHFDPGQYSHNACPATVNTRVDPVTAVLWQAATASRSINHIRFHTGWTNTGGSSQSFARGHGTCVPLAGQRASGSIVSSRWHVRVAQSFDTDAQLGTTTLATPHHEDLVLTCAPPGHAVDANGGSGSGFDQGRKRLREDMANGKHGVSNVNWGNTQNVKQCDGDLAGSNGYVTYIRVPATLH